MINTHDIKQLVKPLLLNAFYLDEVTSNYKLAQKNFETVKEPVVKFLDNFEIAIDAQYHEVAPDVNHQIVTDFRNALDEYQNDLFKLEIPEKEFMSHLQSARDGESIKQYEAIKREFLLKTAPLYFSDDAREFNTAIRYAINEDEDERNENQSQKADKVVLNRHNPFADVNISNQSFLYADDEGHFKTLSFRLGHTMSKIETEQGDAITLQPNFKIVKSNNRVVYDDDISFDDTVSTRLPETQGDAELLYI